MHALLITKRASARLLLSTCVLAGFATYLFAQGTTGSIVGTIQDTSGASVPGAEITATSPQNLSGYHVRSDSAGYYSIVSVPVGTYMVAIIKPGFVTIEQEGVNVTVASQVTASARLQIATRSTAIQVTESVISLDTTSSRTDTTISSKTFDTLAKGRTFNSILAIAPGVRYEPKSGTAGVGGIQVDGSSGLENTYYIEGIQSNDPINGSLRQQQAVPLDFLDQVEVRTGGFEAEYGGAIGGVITTVIKSGTNQFHGMGSFEATADPFNASDRGYWQRSPLNANQADFFAPKKDSYSILYPSFDLGGPLVKNRLFFFAGYTPEIENTTRAINFAAGARTYQQSYLRHYLVSKVDYQLSSKLTINSSWLWSPVRHSGNLPNRDIRVAAPKNDLSIQGGYRPSQSYNSSITYAISPKLILNARYGYKYLNDKDGNYGLSGSPYLTYQTSASQAYSPVPASANFGTNYTNVSTTLATARDQTTRHGINADLTYITTFFGQQHTFKGGYSFERIGENKLSDYTNGRFLVDWGLPFNRAQITNVRGTYGYYTWEDGVKVNSDVHGRNQGFYVQDDWRIHPRVTLNIGVRLENEFIPPYRGTYLGATVANPISFGWGDKIVPRLGGAWDVRGDGRWKVSASFGYFTDTIKYGLAQGSFGGQQWITHVYALNNPDVLSLSRANPGALGPEITSYDNRTIDVTPTGQWNGVDPNIKPFRSRDINVAVDHQLASHLVATLRYTRKDIIRAVEDIGVLDAQGSENYVIGNPGFGETRDTTSVYGQKTPNGQQFLVPPATRRYDGVEFRLQGRIRGLNLIPSYTWSRLYGNYSGLGNSDEAGRSDPNNNRSFDLPYYYFDESGSQRNVFGLLGTDRSHAFKLFSSYELKTKFGNTFFGLNQIAEKGTPNSTSAIYLSAPTYPYGRGDLGRTPAYLQTDLYIAHEFKVSERTAVRLSANLSNLFNQGSVISEVTQLNQSGAISSAQLPVSAFFAGYNVNNFIYPGSAVRYNPIYGLPGTSNSNGGPGSTSGGGPGSTLSSANAVEIPNLGAYQDGRTIRLGLRVTF